MRDAAHEVLPIRQVLDPDPGADSMIAGRVVRGSGVRDRVGALRYPRGILGIEVLLAVVVSVDIELQLPNAEYAEKWSLAGVSK